MKKIILLLIGLSISSLAYGDFEDKHLKCTLVEKNGEVISERQAEGLNEYKINVLVTKTTLETNKRTFKFEKIENGRDIYSYKIYGDIYYKANFGEYSNSLEIKKVVTTVYDENYDSSDVDIYFPDGKEYAYKSKKTRINELKEINRKMENDNNTYACTEATLLEKIKYKFSK